MSKNQKSVDQTKKTSILITVGFIAVVVLIITGLILYNVLGRGTDNNIDTNTPTDRMLVNSEESAKNFTVKDLEGKKAHLSDFNSKPVIMYFWVSWSEPCIDNLAVYQKAYDKYKDNVNFLIINTKDDTQTVKKYTTEKGYTFPCFIDDEKDAASAYGISSLPSVVMTDKSGKIHYQNIGTLNEDSLFSFIDGLIDKK